MQPEAQIVPTEHGPVEVADFGSGPVVLVLHGTMGGWPQAVQIARTVGTDGYRYLAVSRPGYLGTPLHPNESAAAQADLCAALLDALDITRCAVIGVSGGSSVALELALRHPACVWGLVVISGCARGAVTPTIPVPVRLLAQLTRSRRISEWMRAMWARDLDKAATFLVPDPEARARLLAHPGNGPLFAEFLLGGTDRMYLRMKGTLNDVENMRRADPALEDIGTPTLVVHGTADHMLAYADHAPVFAARLPDAELVTIEGGGHAALFTDRDRVRTAVTAFLREHAPAPRREGRLSQEALRA